jgi:hypothetical protein
MKMDFWGMGGGWEADGTGSESCPMTDFGISGVEPSGSALKQSFGDSSLALW